jgi:hypothetical protein
MPPYRVEYYCPRQSPNWQAGNARPLYNLAQAQALCFVLKPNSPLGHARVLDYYGKVVFLL